MMAFALPAGVLAQAVGFVRDVVKSGLVAPTYPTEDRSTAHRSTQESKAP